MDGAAFDQLIRRLKFAAGRRPLLAGLAAAGLAGGVAARPDLTTARKRKKKKKVTICRNGQTISVVKKKKRKHLKPGDTAGKCPATTTLPPRCPAARPNYCARLDSCQPSCTSGHAFDPESCACVCSPATTCCVCKKGADVLEFQNIATASACSQACTSAGGTDPVFAGGNGSAAIAHPTEAACTVTCTSDPMTCPAGFFPDTCTPGTVCNPALCGCCPVDTPTCCDGVCCSPESHCCGATCCPPESHCCGFTCCPP
ncbi:MAG: hypothetical protein U0Z70_24005 [Thermomicrobiales bacterium]|nr:hypothetical protein [Chloroflexia bacterium]